MILWIFVLLSFVLLVLFACLFDVNFCNFMIFLLVFVRESDEREGERQRQKDMKENKGLCG